MTSETTPVILGALGDLTGRLLLPGPHTLLAVEPQRRARVWGAAHTELGARWWEQLVRTRHRNARGADRRGLHPSMDQCAVLRSGNAMAADRTEVVIHFRRLEHVPVGRERPAPPNRLVLDLSDHELRLRIATDASDPKFELTDTELPACLGEETVSAYGEILVGTLDDNPMSSVRGDIAEECWQICAPVFDVWRTGATLEEHPACTPRPWT